MLTAETTRRAVRPAKNKRPVCPRERDEPCWECFRAEAVVAKMDAIMAGSDLRVCYLRAARCAQNTRTEKAIRWRLTLQRLRTPQHKRVSDPHGAGVWDHLCAGTTWTGMGTDSAGTDRDIDANGWYSNARRAYEDAGDA